jgi:hypothetical protein
VLKHRIVKLDQPNAVLRKNLPAQLIITSSLFSTVAAATCHPLVKKGNGFAVLLLSVFNNDLSVRTDFVVSVNWKPPSRSTSQEIKSVLPSCF